MAERSGTIMTRYRSLWTRALLLGGAAGAALVLTGDRPAYLAASPGIDPLEILKLQVKPNVAIILDTSGSMAEQFPNSLTIGGDDAPSKMAQSKLALQTVLRANQGLMNFGLISYFAANSNRRITGPDFRYVSNDPVAARWTGGTGVAGIDTVGDFFGNFNSPFTGANSSDVYRSFDNQTFVLAGDSSGVTCPGPANTCRWYLASRFVRNSVRFRWDTANVNAGGTPVSTAAALLSTTAITCPAPPAALFPNDDLDNDGVPASDPGEGDADVWPRPCVQMEQSVSGAVTTFWYSSARWTGNTSNCGGGRLIAPVASCAADNVPSILLALRPELPVDGSCGNPVGIPCGFGQSAQNPLVDTTTTPPYVSSAGRNPATDAGLNADNALGLLSESLTPLGGSLNYILNNFNTVFPAAIGGIQQNFAILVTDGLETCGGNAPAAAAALYNNNPRVYTFVIGVSISGGALDAIARAGSGGTRDAIPAGNVAQLVAALQAILDTAISTGSLSASNQVIGTVFELIQDNPATPVTEAPDDPLTRYNERINIIYQGTFGLPGWEGHTFAFRNDGSFVPVPSTFTGNWDAGESLFEDVSQVLENEVRGTGRQPNRFTFFELHNGATVDSIESENPTGGGALIRRRLFTSNGNGTFFRDGTADNAFDSASPQGRNVVALWPPNQAGLNSGVSDIDPAAGIVGPLDDALGIGPGSNPVLSFADLQNNLYACTGSTDANSGPIPAACDDLVDPTLALDTARKEARQILLAWLAGAKLDRATNDGLPLRAQDAPSDGQLIFRDRGWLMQDSTFTTPAVHSPPIGPAPFHHVQEYLLFRDGRRDASGQGINEIDKGFGLANPDIDDANPASDPALKPIMTTVFIGTNAMLHAVKGLTAEEMWGYVPYDQLGKLQQLLNPGQLRSPHVYMIATSLRLATFFYPDANGFTLSSPAGPVDFQGRWRTVLLFGRGAGGKHFTAIDVTTPGPYTRAALLANPPWVMWNRGNPDAAQPAEYAGMGETWSIPAIGEVDGPLAGGSDWRVFTGSGFSDVPTEGSTFYQLNLLNGDVIVANDVLDNLGTYVPDNVLVASPAAFNSYSLDYPQKPAILRDPTQDRVTRVYIPDVHGRVWKFDTNSGALFADFGAAQAMTYGPALLKLNDGVGDRPYIFLESGGDQRVPDSAAPFKMFGLKDVGTDVAYPPTGPGGIDSTPVFTIDFPSPPPSNIPFRGAVRPATGYVQDSGGNVRGIAFFAGNRFNPPGADCLSSFDVILFAAVPDSLAASGYAAGYDFTGDSVADLSYIIAGQKAGAIATTGGTPSISLSGNLTSTPPPGGGPGVGFPGPPPTPTPGPPASPTVDTIAVTPGSPVCR
jgi:hypothetical protein